VYYKRDATTYTQIYKTSEVGIEETQSSIPQLFGLSVKPTITLSSLVVCDYDIKREGMVSLKIYDITGKLVKELLNRNIEPGNWTIRWDGTNQDGEKIRSGHYFVMLESGKLSRTEKVVVIR